MSEETVKEVKDLDLGIYKLAAESALAIQLDIDTFFFNITPKQQSVSRRSILSVLNSVYGPLGFLAPVMLTGKTMLQELCKVSCGRDEDVPKTLAEKWRDWLKDLFPSRSKDVLSYHNFKSLAHSYIISVKHVSEAMVQPATGN